MLLIRAALFAGAMVLQCATALGQRAMADHGSVAITGNVVNSPINLGASNEQLEALQNEIRAGAAERIGEQRKLIQTLEKQLALTESQIVQALVMIGEKNVPTAMYGQKLIEFAQTYTEIRRELERVSNLGPTFRAITDKASSLIKSGRFGSARELLAQAQLGNESVRMTAAEFTALQAMTASLEFNYGDAASLYNAAAVLVSSDIEISTKYSLKKAVELLRGSDERTRRDYVLEAISTLRNLRSNSRLDSFPELDRRTQEQYATALALGWNMSRDRELFERAETEFKDLARQSEPGSQTWSGAMLGLGTLYSLSRRNGEAIAVYRDTLKRGELNSVTERYLLGNLAGALSDEGYQHRDTTLLKDSLIYQERALNLVQEENVYERGQSEYNLGITLFRIGNAERDADQLRSAVARFNRSLSYLREESHKVSWAHAQTNLGITLLHLGRIEQKASTLSDAVWHLDLALRVWKRDERLHSWFQAQHNKAMAYQELAKFRVDPGQNTKRSIHLLLEMQRNLDEQEDWSKLLIINTLLGDGYTIEWDRAKQPLALNLGIGYYDKAIGILAVRTVGDEIDWRESMSKGEALYGKLIALCSQRAKGASRDTKKARSGNAEDPCIRIEQTKSTLRKGQNQPQ